MAAFYVIGVNFELWLGVHFCAVAGANVAVALVGLGAWRIWCNEYFARESTYSIIVKHILEKFVAMAVAHIVTYVSVVVDVLCVACDCHAQQRGAVVPCAGVADVVVGKGGLGLHIGGQSVADAGDQHPRRGLDGDLRVHHHVVRVLAVDHQPGLLMGVVDDGVGRGGRVGGEGGGHAEKRLAEGGAHEVLRTQALHMGEAGHHVHHGHVVARGGTEDEGAAVGKFLKTTVSPAELNA